MFKSVASVDEHNLYSMGFSQNALWSAVLGVCFPNNIKRFAQGGSGLAMCGGWFYSSCVRKIANDIVSTGQVSRANVHKACTQSDYKSIGPQCKELRPCDGQGGRPECKYFPVYPAAAAVVINRTVLPPTNGFLELDVAESEASVGGHALSHSGGSGGAGSHANEEQNSPRQRLGSCGFIYRGDYLYDTAVHM